MALIPNDARTSSTKLASSLSVASPLVFTLNVVVWKIKFGVESCRCGGVITTLFENEIKIWLNFLKVRLDQYLGGSLEKFLV